MQISSPKGAQSLSIGSMGQILSHPQPKNLNTIDIEYTVSLFELWCWIRHLSPVDSKEIQPVHPKWKQSWIFIGRTDAEAETPILWPPNVKSWLIGKDPDAGKDLGQEEKGMTEDEMFGWHH